MLVKSDYNKNYFEADNPLDTHPAGYTDYRRSVIFDSVTGRNMHELAHYKFFVKHQIKGKVLELGCAKGFFVEDLRKFGVDAYGIDFSPYIIGVASVQSYITLGDALELKQYTDGEFDVVIGLRFLPCIADPDLPQLIREIKRISKYQIHTVDDRDFYLKHSANYPSLTTLNQYYNIKTLQEWRVITGNNSDVSSIDDEIWEEIR